MALTIRDAVPDDAKSIVHVRDAGWRQAYSHLLSAELFARLESDPERRATGWAAAITRGTRIHVLEVEGDIRGMSIGDGPAFLWTAENNPHANAFYARNRFVPDGAREVRADLDDLVQIRLVRD